MISFHYSKKEMKNVLVVEDNELDSSQIAKMLDSDTCECDDCRYRQKRRLS